ncbi:MAG TPA: hypothetical protein VEK08_20305 [Planctomycetota bacterium]|nr:hypothetical protein [Planctomycetota bacterium]
MELSLQRLLQIAGILQLAVLSAAALTPYALDWRSSLAQLNQFIRRMFWVYGVFIAFTIIAFATLTLAFSSELASGGPLARAVCAFIGLFWAARLSVQLFVFDIRTLKLHWLFRFGYHALTFVFAYLATVYTLAALG